MKKQIENVTEVAQVVKNEVVRDAVMQAVDIEKAVNKVNASMKNIEKGYITIAGEVLRLRDGKAHETLKYTNFYELTADQFGMARGTTHEICKVAKRFFGEDYKMLPQWKEYSFSALIILAPLQDFEIEFAGVNPQMSCKKLREIVDKLTGSADAYIETEADEVLDADADEVEEAEAVESKVVEKVSETVFEDIDEAIAFLLARVETGDDKVIFNIKR